MTSAGQKILTSSRPPLAGIRILDLTHAVAGSFCTMILADMGADVVKVERPVVGDELRAVVRYPGRKEHDEDYFYSLNRRKRSVVIDLKDPLGQELAQRLSTHSDIVVQNFAPGTAERLGVGPDELRRLNPRLVYCAISGFGQTGPLRNRLAMDPIIQAMSGIMSVTGEPNDPPMGVGAPITDVIAGIFAAYVIVAALFEARRAGVGTFIDVSMLECMISALSPRMAEALQAGRQPDRMGNENPMRVPSGLFEGSDGGYVRLQVHSDNFWKPFCRALGREEWIDDPRFATRRLRVQNRVVLNELIRQRLQERIAAEWVERLTAERVPCAPVYDYLQVLQDPHVQSRGLIIEVAHPRSGWIRLVGPPWKFSYPSPRLTPPPLLGEHSIEVLREWLGETGES